jgi:adenylate cyclase class IV
MYEIEIKVELSNNERLELIESFKKRNFVSKGVTPQNDYYVEAHESPYGAFDLKRYRNEDGKFIYTEKVWELINEKPFRREDEHEVSKEEFEAKIVEFPNALKIVKDREWFVGSYQDAEISITIDSVKFNHSPDMRYFIEAEIGVTDKEVVSKTRELIENFLKDILNREEIVESPGMFKMAFRKL